MGIFKLEKKKERKIRKGKCAKSFLLVFNQGDQTFLFLFLDFDRLARDGEHTLASFPGKSEQ